MIPERWLDWIMDALVVVCVLCCIAMVVALAGMLAQAIL